MTRLALAALLALLPVGAWASDADQLEADWRASGERLITDRTYRLDRPVTLCIHRPDWELAGLDNDRHLVIDFMGRDLDFIVQKQPRVPVWSEGDPGAHDITLGNADIGHEDKPGGLTLKSDCAAEGKPIT